MKIDQYVNNPKTCKVCTIKKDFPTYCGICNNLKPVSDIIKMHQDAIKEVKRIVKKYLLGVDIDTLKE
jgi:hypothetical protein